MFLTLIIVFYYGIVCTWMNETNFTKMHDLTNPEYQCQSENRQQIDEKSGHSGTRNFLHLIFFKEADPEFIRGEYFWKLLPIESVYQNSFL